MPHPEHAVDPLTGSGVDGLPFFAGLARLPSVREDRTQLAVQR
jgi:hypothetical protein